VLRPGVRRKTAFDKKTPVKNPPVKDHEGAQTRRKKTDVFGVVPRPARITLGRSRVRRAHLKCGEPRWSSRLPVPRTFRRRELCSPPVRVTRPVEPDLISLVPGLLDHSGCSRGRTHSDESKRTTCQLVSNGVGSRNLRSQVLGGPSHDGPPAGDTIRSHCNNPSLILRVVSRTGNRKTLGNVLLAPRLASLSPGPGPRKKGRQLSDALP